MCFFHISISVYVVPLRCFPFLIDFFWKFKFARNATLVLVPKATKCKKENRTQLSTEHFTLWSGWLDHWICVYTLKNIVYKCPLLFLFYNSIIFNLTNLIQKLIQPNEVSSGRKNLFQRDFIQLLSTLH